MTTRRSRTLAVLFALLLVAAGIGPAAAAGVSGVAGSASSSGAPAEVSSTAFQTGTQPANCSFPVTRTDATGTEVTVEEEPERVVALGANIAQIAWTLDAEEKIVGMPVQPYTAYLNGSENRTGIYNQNLSVEAETVVSTNPDLVLAPNIITNETVSALRDTGLTVYRSPFGGSLTDVYGEVNATGRLLGACGAANETVATMQERVNAIESAVEGEGRPPALYRTPTGFVAGNGTFIGAIMETAGASNVVDNVTSDRPYFELSSEVVVNRSIEWLVVTNASTVPTDGAIANTTAVRENQTIVVNADYISQSGPLIVRPMTEIARTLHPEAIAAANLSNVSFLADEENETGGTNATNGTDTANATNGTTETVGTTDDAAATTDIAGADTATTDEATGTDTTAGATTGDGTMMAPDEDATGTIAETDTATTAATETGEATNTDAAAETDTPTGTTGGSGPGFGIVATAIALLGAGLLASRRR